MDTGSAVGQQNDSTRTPIVAMFGALAILVGLAALYFEPYTLLSRIDGELRRGDSVAVERLIAPNLHGKDLASVLALACASKGTVLTRRYDGFDRFLVIARPSTPSQESWAGQSEIRFWLHRRGLRWTLSEVEASAH